MSSHNCHVADDNGGGGGGVGVGGIRTVILSLTGITVETSLLKWD